MARQLIRYHLEGNNTTPLFVDYGCGGHFKDPANDEFVGVSIDNTKRYLPATVFILTRAQLKTRLEILGLNVNEDETTMTSAELDAYIQDWLDGKDLGSLA